MPIAKTASASGGWVPCRFLCWTPDLAYQASGLLQPCQRWEQDWHSKAWGLNLLMPKVFVALDMLSDQDCRIPPSMR